MLVAAALCTTTWSCTQPRLPQTYGPVDLVIAATTDLHGYVRGWDYYANAPDTVRGLTRVATIIDSLRKVSPTFPSSSTPAMPFRGTRSPTSPRASTRR